MDDFRILGLLQELSENIAKMNVLLEKIEKQNSTIETNSNDLYAIKSETEDVNFNLKKLISLTKENN